jgi:RNA polymerase sigma-70 factor (ECF subfamily)
MESFLKSVERQAYRMALVASSNRDDALDLVQGAMCRFVDRYTTRPASEWKPLFYRILHNGIRDFHRRQSIRRRWRTWLHGPADKPGEDREDPLEQAADPAESTPEDRTTLTEASEALEQALRELPPRQQQTFLLRCGEEMSVAETARIMRCSEGSVKTHLSRAVTKLRTQLGDHWP